MSKEKIVFIISTVMMVVASITTVFAANYLYNSNEVSYDNTNSGLESDNVQGAIDELYGHATDYTSIASRVSTLEGNFQISAGTVNITGNPVKINNTDVSFLSSIGTRQMVSPENLSIATSTVKSIGYIDLTPGTWILMGVVRFDANATGRRYASFSTTLDPSTSGAMSIISQDITPAVEGFQTFLHIFEGVTYTSNTRIYINGWQNSGSSLTAAARIYAIKVK